MNKWSCDHPGCGAYCLGVGGAIGLLAIGWEFHPRADGARTFCPAHRHDSLPCVESGEAPAGKACSLCAAEAQARRIQNELRAAR